MSYKQNFVFLFFFFFLSTVHMLEKCLCNAYLSSGAVPYRIVANSHQAVFFFKRDYEQHHGTQFL